MRGGSMDLAVTDALSTIHADTQRLDRVLNNLLGDALRHTPAGGRVQMHMDTTPLAFVLFHGRRQIDFLHCKR